MTPYSQDVMADATLFGERLRRAVAQPAGLGTPEVQ